MSLDPPLKRIYRSMRHFTIFCYTFLRWFRPHFFHLSLSCFRAFVNPCLCPSFFLLSFFYSRLSCVLLAWWYPLLGFGGARSVDHASNRPDRPSFRVPSILSTTATDQTVDSFRQCILEEKCTVSALVNLGVHHFPLLASVGKLCWDYTRHRATD